MSEIEHPLFKMNELTQLVFNYAGINYVKPKKNKNQQNLQNKI